MQSPIISSISSIGPRLGRHAMDTRLLLAGLVAVTVYVLFMLLGRSVLADPDTFWHVATGRWIFHHGTVPVADPFSHTMPGAPWSAWEWLAQLVLAGANTAMGWPGAAAVSVAAIALAFAIQFRFLLDHLRVITAIEIVAVALVLISGHVLARPHALAYPILTLWCAGLIRANDQDRPPSMWLLPWMTLWANLHGSFVFGLAFIGPMALEALIAAPAVARRRTAVAWMVFAAAAGFAACLTPYGPKLFPALIRAMSAGDTLRLISEWRATDFGHYTPMEPVLLAGLGLALHLGVRLPPIRIVVLLGLLFMAFTHVRHYAVLALVLPLLIARPLAEQFGGSDGIPSLSKRARMGTAILCVAAVLGVTLRDIRPPDANMPRSALAAIRGVTKGPIFNDYNFGGFLMFSGIPTSIDGREMFGEPFILRHFQMLDGHDETALRAFLDEHHIEATLLNPRTPAVAVLDMMPQWRRIHSDEFAVAHVKR